MRKPLEAILAQPALFDLRDIYRWSIAEFGHLVADDYVRDLEAAIERLCQFPQLGMKVEGATRAQRVLPVRSHRVVYTFNRKRVRVLRVLHQAMEVGRRV